jgi:hypothetical protein
VEVNVCVLGTVTVKSDVTVVAGSKAVLVSTMVSVVVIVEVTMVVVPGVALTDIVVPSTRLNINTSGINNTKIFFPIPSPPVIKYSCPNFSTISNTNMRRS